mgnify:CR=1 FL=1
MAAKKKAEGVEKKVKEATEKIDNAVKKTVVKKEAPKKAEMKEVKPVEKAARGSLSEPARELATGQAASRVKKTLTDRDQKAPRAEKPNAEESKEEDISKKLVAQVREGIIKDKEEKPSLQATPKRSEFIAVVHVHASKNNTIVTVTDLSGAETLGGASGGMVSRTGREEKSPFAGGQIAKKMATVLRENGVHKVDVLLRGKGGHRGQNSPGRAASAVIKILARSGIRIRRIEDVTPIPHGGCKPPGGKRGRRV